MFIQGGLFALGPNSSLNEWTGRFDVTIQLMWQLENMGMGNLGRIKAQRGLESRAIVELRNAQDMVAADVNRALAACNPRRLGLSRPIALSARASSHSTDTSRVWADSRLENVLVLTFRPQEAVYSLELLNVAFDEYFTTVAEYNRGNSTFSTRGLPGSGTHSASASRRGSASSTRRGRPTCPRWATGRLRPPGKRWA